MLLILIPFYSNAQEKEIKRTIETFFEGFHARDTLKIKSVCHDSMLLQSISENSKAVKLTEEKVAMFYKAIASFPPQLKFEEKILDYTIRIDGTMAHAWTPYEFLIQGKVVHTGVNSFTLLFENDNWRIVHIIDTRRKK